MIDMPPSSGTMKKPLEGVSMSGNGTVNRPLPGDRGDLLYII